MNINVWKKHLVGKAVAFSSFGTIDGKYRGVISDVLESPSWGGSLFLLATGANFHAVQAFMLGNSTMHAVQLGEGDTSLPVCEEPVLDGCVPLGELVRLVILPEEENLNKLPVPPDIRELIKETGTFTGCKELTDEFVQNGLIRKEDKVLHVDFKIAQNGCMCGFATEVEQIEFVTRDLKKFFEVDEIVYHFPTKRAGQFVTVEVEPGYKGSVRHLPGAYEGDPWCGTYPIIKGLGMRWEPAVEK